ncbi:hypothetical protein ABEV55_08465 [Aneurinibacillus thermoaerophilus]|uniref:hypothetical protein n=1 Tax=Aneurinibacillus thermoaerophilus TaxID=143495 RepID=UPI002E1F8432|nr:hypothetical protein [Aneurinibacillus thermoaerophilus]
MGSKFSFGVLFEQAIRLLQLIGIPAMAGLFIIGLLLLLTAGKNPLRKRIGFIFTLGFGFGTLAVAYVPAIAYTVSGEAPQRATGHETLEGMVNSSSFIGESLFTAIQYTMIPLTFTTFYMGVIIRLLAAKNPQRRRIGIGFMMFSPIVLGMSYVVPRLITYL